MILDQNSKFFKFLTWHNDYAKYRMIESGNTDTCEVLRLAAVSSMILFVALLGVVIMLSLIGAALGWFVAVLLHGFIPAEDFAAVGVILISVAFVGALLFFLSRIELPEVITESVRSKLDKICTFIEVK